MKEIGLQGITMLIDPIIYLSGKVFFGPDPEIGFFDLNGERNPTTGPDAAAIKTLYGLPPLSRSS